MNRFKAKAYHKPGMMNTTERDYANYLAILKAAGEVEDFTFEPEKLKIGTNCHLTPDFRVLRQGIIEFHDCKAAWKNKTTGKAKPHVEDDALVKMKVASDLHPYKFFIVWKENGTWQSKEII